LRCRRVLSDGVTKRDMIISGDLKVYPRDVDEVLFSHSKILECAIGISHAYSSERTKAFVVLKPGMKDTADEIIAYCKDNLVKYKVPKYVEFVDDLPKSAIGKILQKETRRMALVKGEKSGER
jgi:long-chain acyl-CoA synthetase